MQEKQSRRQFLTQTALSAAMLPILPVTASEVTERTAPAFPKIHLFSKHLQFLDYPSMAEVAAELGFDGLDLTVRPKGHVLPEKVETDLPKAVEAMKKVGFTPSLMTTAIEDAGNPVDYNVLTTAAKAGFKYYRMNWYRFSEEKTIPESILEFREKIGKLSLLNKQLGLTGCYQNHSGRMVGASIWELWEMFQKADPTSMGAQYDIRHATVEGGLSWQTGLRLIQPHIKTIVLKDCMWEKKNGKWGITSTPLGEGMVDFDTYFKLLKKYRIDVPVCLHLEYPLGGADSGAFTLSVDKKVVFEAMKRDLAKVKELWEKA